MSVFGSDTFDNVFDSACTYFNYSSTLHDENVNVSLLCFSVSLELFLKLRLFKEHWSLTIDDMNNFNKKKAEFGDFYTVNASDIISRIKNCSLGEFEQHEIDAYNDIIKDRNRVIHFYDIAYDTSKINNHIILAWYYIYKRLTTHWRDIFSDKQLEKLSEIENELVWNKNYAKKIYPDKKKYIEERIQAGDKVKTCESCKQKSYIGTPVNPNKDSIFNISMQCCICDHKYEEEIMFICQSCEKNAVINISNEMLACPYCSHEIECEKDLFCSGCNKTTIAKSQHKYFCISCWFDYDISTEIEKCKKCNNNFLNTYLEDNEGIKICAKCSDDIFNETQKEKVNKLKKIVTAGIDAVGK